MEAFLRFIDTTPLWRVLPVAEVSLYGPDAATGYAHRAGVAGIWTTENRARVSINEQGFRGPPVASPKPSGEIRVAVLGDSITEALQVDEPATFVALSEAALRTAGHNVRVLNFGLAGAGPAVQAERLRTFAVRFEPDIVTLMPTIGDFFSNAANDDSAYPAFLVSGDGTVRLGSAFRNTKGYAFRTSAAGRAMYWLLDHLHVARVLNARKNIGFLPAAAPALPERQNRCETAAVYWRQLSETKDGWKRMQAFLSVIGETARQHGFRPVVLMRGLAVPAGCGQAVAPHRQTVRDRLASLAIATDVPVLDADAAIEAELPPGRSSRDMHGFGVRIGAGHLNHAGHAIYASALNKLLLPLLPPGSR